MDDTSDHSCSSNNGGFLNEGDGISNGIQVPVPNLVLLKSELSDIEHADYIEVCSPGDGGEKVLLLKAQIAEEGGNSCTRKCNKEDINEISVKRETIESEDEILVETLVEDGNNTDVYNKVSGNKSEIDIEELPLKTELTEGEEESLTEIHIDEDNSGSYLKVEPLEESYEDRMNDFLHVVTTEKLSLQVGSTFLDPGNKDSELENKVENGHFLLAQVKQKRRGKSASLQCAKCSAKFKYQSTYDYHVKSECGSKVIAKTQLVKAKKNQTFICNLCNKQVCSRTSLMVHMRIHNGERPFSCDVCSRAFYQKAHLKDHMKIHASGKVGRPLLYTCAECGKVFNEKRLLTSHMSVHFGDRVFDCEICHKRFRTRSNLSNHKLIHSEKKEHQCTVCGREFLRKPSLYDHLRTHSKEKPFECGICGKRFAEKNRRNTHVKRHTGELTAVCSTCGKKFACSYDLRIHQRSHTGEKPFSCNICGRMFNRKAIMETHMTIHTGRKDFVCTQCGEAFNRKSKLDVHLTSHTGEQFICEICHRVFKCKAYLVPHVRTHFGQGRQRGKTCQCLICRQKFTSTHGLQDHLVHFHPSLFSSPST